MNRNTAWQVCALAAVAIGVVTPSCATNLDLGQPSENAAPDAEPAPSFTSKDAGDATVVADAAGAKLCIATTCPSPYATCEFDKYKCQTNLSSDSSHCGACDVQCPTYPQLKVTSRCVAGKCEFACSPAGGSIKDCNGIVDDGCETDVATDRFNCGACGNVCPAGQNCHEGKCGCPPGKSECNGACVDLANDDFNCGACGAACDTSENACGVELQYAHFGCGNGQCGHLKCSYVEVADCNKDLGLGCASDGCETIIGLDDPQNCGACGHACKANEQCENGSCVVPPPAAPTSCPDGLLLCGAACIDPLTDVSNCGGCGSRCVVGPKQVGTCKKGVCQFECEVGWGDCTDTWGCETNLANHPAHCGACGNRCDTAAGQPCIEGQCLMAECDAGETK